jgi:hypothetical protein
MRFLIISACAIVGLILGILFWQASEVGLAQIWEKLPAPPNAVIELIPVDGPTLYIKTSDGATYRYEDWHNEGWVEEAVHQILASPFEITRPCDLLAPEFSKLSDPPQDMVDCVQAKDMGADGYVRSTFLLDANGSIWQSTTTRNASDTSSMMICIPGFGLFVGASIGVAVASLSRRRKDVTDKTPVIL